ncbi:hypothetical protein WJT86_12225 [Microvirga sp. W0021]|uniref:Uncharacterized protein n=1 Tax=Hohaiivirga grylli TaxID=3133970 RepID=A0ABV0BLF2_9HYPH
MNSKLSVLIALKIINQSDEDNALYLSFEGGYRLCIESKYFLLKDNFYFKGNIIGNNFVRIIELKDKTEFLLQNDIKLIIDMSDCGYNTPEAVILGYPDGSIIVWN